MQDRVGIGWRGELAAGITSRLEDIDVLEILAENYFKANRREIESLRFLSAQRPIFLHGVSMGLASVSPVDRTIVEKMAKLVDTLQPELWSEHLAFVRSSHMEIGHLAAPPRNHRTIEGAVKNINTASKIVGCAPVLENIATLVEPLFSEMDELSWIQAILNNVDSPMLLDLHNLYSNCFNDQIDFLAALAKLNLARVQVVHIAGGRVLSEGESQENPMLWLDDHKHPTPPIVFAALAYIAANTDQPLTVILERDGNFPEFDELADEILTARNALKKGRKNRADTRKMTGDSHVF